MTNNEIQKYIWQDFSSRKLIAFAAVSLIIFISLLNLDKNNTNLALSFTSLAFFVSTVAIASLSAMNSIFDEINDHTWNSIRLSPVSPWQLTFGKLIGSTLFCYYVGFFAISAHYYFLIKTTSDPLYSLVIIFRLFLCAAFANALSLLMASLTLFSNNKNKKVRSNILYLICLGFSLILYNSLGFDHKIKQLNWYGFDFADTEFLTASVAIFFLWSIFATYRILKQNLMYPVTPIAWTSFVIFIIFYLCGFIDVNDYKNFDQLLLAFLTSITFTYIAAFCEKINIAKVKILIAAIKSKNLNKIFQSTAKWIPTLIISLFLLLFSIFCDIQKNTSLIAFEVFIFLLRDLAIIHFFRFFYQDKKSSFSILFCFITIYAIIPIFFLSLKLEFIAQLFLPILGEIDFTKLSFLLIQSAIAMFLAFKSYKKLSNNSGFDTVS
ncbi:MAG: ABC transporter permease [Rickettsiales bacterium]|nr:ABC transporter permease [Rickettsiales bacterium]